MDRIDVYLDIFGPTVVGGSRQRPVLVYCRSSECPRCQQLDGFLQSLLDDLQGTVLLAVIDIEREKELAEQLDVNDTPTLILFVDGKQVDRQTYPDAGKHLLSWLRPHMPSPATEAISAAEKAIKERKRTLALNQATIAVRADQQNPQSFEVQVRAALLNHDHITARAALSQLRELEGGEILAQRLAPLVEMEAERFRYANVDPESLSGHFGKTLAEMAKQNWTEACEHLLVIIDKDPQWEGGKALRRINEILDTLPEDDPLEKQIRKRLARIHSSP